MRRFVRRWSIVYAALLLFSFLFQLYWPTASLLPPGMSTAAIDDTNETGKPATLHMAYREAGQGPPLILLHGSPGNANDFHYILPFLSNHYHVIAPDLIGWGASQPWATDYGISAQARYVEELMDALHVDSAHVLGFSMGGGIAIELAHSAPRRVRSLTLWGGIGIQEGEGSGDYHFEHFKYACGYALFVVAPEFIPHFGQLGRRSERNTFIRSFWDTDQRPIRAMLPGLKMPVLILQGRDDPLVPADTAREHHRLIADSELKMLDTSHFLLFSERGSRQLADELLPFLDRVDRGQPPLRKTQDLPDKPRPALLPGDFQLERRIGPWFSMLAIMAATFVSEDMTCITAGLLIHRGHLDFFVGLLGCFWGIFLGDLGLWLIGRLWGQRVMRLPWVAARMSEERLEAMRHWFDRHGWKAVLSARFLPGTRFPVYIAAGVVGHNSGRFLLWAACAALLWTPLLVGTLALFGDQVLDPLQHFLGNGWITLLVAALLLYFLVHAAIKSITRVGRAQLWAGISRFWRWEFWPAWLFYLPLVPYLLYLAVRYRGITVPTAANPAIPHGGVIGESKYDILRRLPPESIVPTAIIPAGDIEARLAKVASDMERLSLGWPVILKPDAGQRGVGLKLARNIDDARAHLAAHPDAVVLQGYHPGPFEAGVFYYRMPATPDSAEEPGRIYSITDKHFSSIDGDGRHTLEELIWLHPRYRMQADTFLKRHTAVKDRVLGAGERFVLAVAGNHCQGTLFRDGAHLITPALRERIDTISRQFGGFYFGRFDIRYHDPELLRAGQGFAIIELNGVTSESTNIYDPSWSLPRAYRVLFGQWRILFEIGARNRAAGHGVSTIREIMRDARAYYRNRRVNMIAD